MKVKIKGFIYRFTFDGSFVFFNSDSVGNDHCVFICPCEFEAEIPEELCPTKERIRTLKNRLAAVNREHDETVKTINKQIDDLLMQL